MVMAQVHQPAQERPLSIDERRRLHTAIIEAESALEDLPGWIPDDWIRLIHAPIIMGRAMTGCYSVNLIAHENRRLRAYQAGLLSPDTPPRWWHRLIDWWWKW